MGLFNLNFNFGRKEKRISEIPYEQFEKIKFKARIAVVDDEEVPLIEKLQKDGYNITKYPDIDEIDSFIRKKYNVLVLDIQGVGKNIAGKKEGWGILSYLKNEYPHLVIIVFTGADWSITKFKEIADLADFVIGKDLEYLDFKAKLDAAIKKAFSPKFHFEIERNLIAKEITNAETFNKIKEIVDLYGQDKDKAMRKLNKVTDNSKVIDSVDTYLSIVSNILSLLN
ncbi:MAG TPA: hypothetical protein DCG75_14530 [Bacteroidales bacterium]|nr:hypothetical protein [Bacteroidales bacterium]